MPPVGFELTNSEGKWQQTYNLDRAATGTNQMDGMLAQYIKRSDQVMTPVDVLTQWQELKGEFKKGVGYLTPNGHYKCCQEDVFYTDVQKFMQYSWQYRQILPTVTTENNYSILKNILQLRGFSSYLTQTSNKYGSVLHLTFNLHHS
jgi:hypothetical protein